MESLKSEFRDGMMIKPTKMLLFILLICIFGNADAQTLGSLHTEAYTYQQEEFVIDKGIDLKEGLKQLEEHANVVFLFRSDVVKGKEVSKRMRLSDNVSKALEKLLEDQDLIFKYINPKTYGIYAPEEMTKKLEGTLLQQVSGTVTDATTGESLPGVNILLKGTNTGTSTNGEGDFELTVESLQDTLVFSYIGYERLEVPINGRTNIDVALNAATSALDEVVVSALGFEENRDESSSSTSNISSENLSRSGENDLLGGLSAQAPGLDITSSAGDPGAASRVVIRGTVSLQGDNQPLFIVDGVPISNSSLGNSNAGVIQQSRINDLNPQDIASVEVLKGPSAASLWGSRAANGAIVIETKNGSYNQDFQVNFSSELSIDKINKSVDMQRKYGQGEGGEYVWGSSSSWGDKISERSGGEDVRARSNYPYSEIIEKNSRETFDQSTRFFETGYGINNSLALSGGGENSAFRLSVGNLNQKGIALDNSNYERTSVKANVQHSFTEEFSADVNVNYTNTNSDRLQKGSNTNSLALGAYRSPPDFDHDPYIVDYVDPNGNIISGMQRSYRNPSGNPNRSAGYENPLWAIYQNNNFSKVNRVFGNTELNYNPNSWLSLTHRLGVDYYDDRRFEILPPGNASVPSGSLEEDNYSEFQINSDLIARASYQLNQNFSGSVLFGWNLNHRDFDHLYVDATNFVLRTAPRNVNNALDAFPGQYRSTQRTSALYSEVKLDAYDQLFLTLTGRSESASTYGPDTDNTYFYPSVGLAWDFTELNTFDNSLLSFGKLRVSYGQAGVQPGVYNTQTTYSPAAFGDGWGAIIDAISYGRGTTRSSQQGNANLSPEITTEYEFGTDLRFLNDRLRISATQYYTFTKDAILGLDIAPSTGFSSVVSNGAEIENYGTELELGADIIQSGKFQWTTDLNWATNQSEVTDLSGVESVTLGGIGTVTNRAIVGEPLGVLYGSVWERDENGDKVLNSNGYPILSAEPGIIGDPNPDWTAGVSNTFSYGSLSLNVLFDIKHGRDMHNGTRGRMVSFGTHGSQTWETTASQDLINYNGEVIPEGTTFRGYVEDFGAGPVAIDEAWFTDGPGSGFSGPTGQFVEDAGFVRLKHLSVQYTINTSSFQNWSGLSSIVLGITAQNLALWTDYSGIDPETNMQGPTNAQGNDYFNNPNTQSYIFTLSVNY